MGETIVVLLVLIVVATFIARAAAPPGRHFPQPLESEPELTDEDPAAGQDSEPGSGESKTPS